MHINKILCAETKTLQHFDRYRYPGKNQKATMSFIGTSDQNEPNMKPKANFYTSFNPVSNANLFFIPPFATVFFLLLIGTSRHV